MSSKYTLITPGTGYSPHVLENPDDPKDKIFLCSCGGTSNPRGYCDGTHTKKSTACECLYCLPQEKRIK
ncbi:MAG: hypothetical protein JW922_09175 [Paludibacteraceae bacterium]|nr:hypothetical protein [Paludibacteraceae bacterium]